MIRFYVFSFLDTSQNGSQLGLGKRVLENSIPLVSISINVDKLILTSV